ncbi:hypothetical protein AB0P37_24195 [Streptomyces antimycoticus]|uniref:hypothetical protein n=1 Tax=Streptomyces antimycoticus TaxID=68175 RepID=UPI003448C484
MVTSTGKKAHSRAREGMARRSRRSVLAMLSAAAVLALAGSVLLVQGNSSDSQAPAQPSARSIPRKPYSPSAGSVAPRRSAGPALREHGPQSEAAPTGQEVLPPPGDGAAGDTAVQQALDHSSPPDLSPEAERRLVRLGRAVWTAEVTGRGRQRWPDYFPDAEVRSYRRFRIQAAIARRAGSRRVVVHLVWAAASPSGTGDADNRTARVFLVRNGGNTWTPSR